MTASDTRSVAPLSTFLVTREYLGDQDLHFYWRRDIADTSLLYVFALCEELKVHPTPHARERLTGQHWHAMYFCEACLAARDADDRQRELLNTLEAESFVPPGRRDGVSYGAPTGIPDLLLR
ncbi:hypothetical protein AB5J62_03350 [Amycolatopsis sp. cg5]|uniref:hypothetical protein n=1 Tax=Amycolatopsis sp. cg5 TaxID=3238802 RepID=UPI0035267E68